ncbi:MAG: lanthionine synthetase LanC family protein [Myxococcota bacterium]
MNAIIETDPVDSVPGWEVELAPFLEELVIVSTEEARLGQRVIRASDPVVMIPDSWKQSPPLVHRITYLVYERAYASRFSSEPTPPPAMLADLVGPLLAASEHPVRWSLGWKAVSSNQQGKVVVQRGEQVREVSPHEVVVVPGATGEVHVPAEVNSLAIQPGFWHVFGDANRGRSVDGLCFRLYFNTRAERAPALINALATALNRAKLPFTLKTQTSSAGYRRRDSTVLFVSIALRDLILAAVAPVIEAHRDALDDDVPLFSRKIAPGVGVAEDPGRNESFGMNRSYLVAVGIWNAFAAGVQDVKGRLDSIRTVLREAGLDPIAPVNEAGSSYRYDLPPARELVRPVARGRVTDDLVQGAYELGLQVAVGALWDDDRCTWLRDTMEPVNETFVPVTRAAGPDLYSGTTGVALFMACLHEQIAEPVFEKTARGAIRYALARLEQNPQILNQGFYSGRTGLAWALTHVGRRLRDPSMRTQAEQVLREIIDAEPDDATDILNGAAGTIQGLLALASEFPELDLEGAAVRRADWLIEQAVPMGNALAWKTIDENLTSAPLCGLSHGTAGIALALAEVFARTKIDKYRAAALRGFAYERMHFDAHQANWPDLRNLSGQPPPQAAASPGSAPSPTYMNAWCHGAAGGALARLRAMRLLDDPTLMAEARSAANTAASGLVRGDPDMTYCHGKTGLCEVLVAAAEALFEPWRRDIAIAFMRRAVAIHTHTDQPWGCGVPNGGVTPDLMLGLSGIGLHLLRLDDASSAPNALVITG